jgi:mannose-6-phosphate isomerase-like protein (cupin superfamily)
MDRKPVSREEMLKRTAFFNKLQPSSMPLVDAVLPQFHRQIFNIIGGGVTEDPTMHIPIRDVSGFHMSIVKAEPQKGTGLHDHTTVEVFMPLQGSWAIIWGSDGENELVLKEWDVVSVPPGVNRGFRNVGKETGHLLVVLEGTDPGRVAWVDNVMNAVREKGFDLDEKGKITGGAVA